jgi:hypothetical protein
MQETLWKDLGRPSIDSSVQQLVINSMKQETKGRSIEALAASRDRRIVSLLTARRQTQRL